MEADCGCVLVVDDERSIRDAVATALSYEGFAVRTAESGRAALHSVRETAPDVVILDVMLPDMDGIEVCRLLRAAELDSHVLFLTARTHVANKVTGLGAGGDDYITKPFSLAEVVARVKAIMRRRRTPPAPPATDVAAGEPDDTGRCGGRQVVCGDVLLDLDSHQVWRGGAAVTLTATEFRLLSFLVQNPQRVLSKQQILSTVWDNGDSRTPNVVEAYVRSLRRKLDPHGPPLIRTIRLVGYVLHPHGDPRTSSTGRAS